MATLFFLLEGSDDERFFKYVLEKKFLKKYSKIKLFTYANRPKKQLEAYVKTLNHGHKDYIILTDFDNATCVTDKKLRLHTSYPFFVESNIAISKCEIESWYLSGLNYADCGSLNIPYNTNTERISKEDFNKIIPHMISRVDFMTDVLKKFKFDDAMKQNSSFKYFSKKYLRHCIK